MAKITWLGHACTLIELSGHKVLVDPWITNPLSPYKSIDDFINEVKLVDFIAVTHDHGDHIGDAIDLMRRFKGVKLVGVYELANELGSRANALDRVVGANVGGPIKLSEDLIVVLTPAHHSSTIGDPVGVVLIGREGSIYHAGDTGLFSEMSLIAELYSIKIALLPIGGHFTMGVREALKAIELIKPRYVIPIHYNTFDLIKVDPQELVEGVKSSKLPTDVVVLKPGESLSF